MTTQKKIDQLPSGGAVQASDLFLIERTDGDSYKVLGSALGGLTTNTTAYDGNDLTTTVNSVSSTPLEIDGGTILVTDPTGGSPNSVVLDTALANAYLPQTTTALTITAHNLTTYGGTPAYTGTDTKTGIVHNVNIQLTQTEGFTATAQLGATTYPAPVYPLDSYLTGLAVNPAQDTVSNIVIQQPVLTQPPTYANLFSTLGDAYCTFITDNSGITYYLIAGGASNTLFTYYFNGTQWVSRGSFNYGSGPVGGIFAFMDASNVMYAAITRSNASYAYICYATGSGGTLVWHNTTQGTISVGDNATGITGFTDTFGVRYLVVSATGDTDMYAFYLSAGSGLSAVFTGTAQGEIIIPYTPPLPVAAFVDSSTQYVIVGYQDSGVGSGGYNLYYISGTGVLMTLNLTDQGEVFLYGLTEVDMISTFMNNGTTYITSLDGQVYNGFDTASLSGVGASAVLTEIGVIYYGGTNSYSLTTINVMDNSLLYLPVYNDGFANTINAYVFNSGTASWVPYTTYAIGSNPWGIASGFAGSTPMVGVTAQAGALYKIETQGVDGGNQIVDTSGNIYLPPWTAAFNTAITFDYTE
jgi:hypothetical protein